MLGMIMLVGIIVNNGIVLVDYINQLRIGGMDRREAIADAAVTRLRPILMTSITTPEHSPSMDDIVPGLRLGVETALPIRALYAFSGKHFEFL